MNTGCLQTFGSACNYNFCCTIKLLNKINKKLEYKYNQLSSRDLCSNIKNGREMVMDEVDPTGSCSGNLTQDIQYNLL